MARLGRNTVLYHSFRDTRVWAGGMFRQRKDFHLPRPGFTFASVFDIIENIFTGRRRHASALSEFISLAGRAVPPHPGHPRNLGVTALFLCAAYWASGLLIGHTGGENNSALVFVLAVALISLLTSGYFTASPPPLSGALCINIYFMEPYESFSSTAPATRWPCCPW